MKNIKKLVLIQIILIDYVLNTCILKVMNITC